MSAAPATIMSVVAPAPLVVVKTKAEREAEKLAAMSAEWREAYLLAEKRAKEARDEIKRIREEEEKQKKEEKEKKKEQEKLEKEKKKEQDRLEKSEKKAQEKLEKKEEKKRQRDAESAGAAKQEAKPKKGKIEPKSREEIREENLTKLYLDAATDEAFEGYDAGIARAVYAGAYLFDPRPNLPSEYKKLKQEQEMFSSHASFFSSLPINKLEKLIEALETALKRKNPLGIYKLYAEMAKDILKHLKSRELVELVDDVYVLNKTVAIDENVWESAVGTAEDILESLDAGCDKHIRHHLSIPKPVKETKPKKEVPKKVKPLTLEQIAVVTNAEDRHKVLLKIVKRCDAFRGVTQLDEKSAAVLDELLEILHKLKALPREIEEVADQGFPSPLSTVSIVSEPASAFRALVEREEHLDMEMGVMQSEYDLQLRQKEDADMQVALQALADDAPQEPADPMSTETDADVDVDGMEEDEEESKPAESNPDQAEDVSEPATEGPAKKAKTVKPKARRNNGRKPAGGRKGKKVVPAADS